MKLYIATNNNYSLQFWAHIMCHISGQVGKHCLIHNQHENRDSLHYFVDHGIYFRDRTVSL